MWIWIWFGWVKDDDVLFQIGKISFTAGNWVGLLAIPVGLLTICYVVDDAVSDNFGLLLGISGFVLLILILLLTTFFSAIFFYFSINDELIIALFWILFLSMVVFGGITIFQMRLKKYRFLALNRILSILRFRSLK